MTPTSLRRVRWACMLGAGLAALFVLSGGNGQARVLRAQAAEDGSSLDGKAWRAFLTPDDLSAMLEAPAEEVADDTKSSGRFRRGYRKLVLTGKLIGFLGNVGVVMGEGDVVGKSAALREAGLQLSEAAEERDYGPAEAAAGVITGFPSKVDPADDAEKSPFEEVMELRDLMLLVNGIERDLAPLHVEGGKERFEKQAKEKAGQALLLASLGLASRDYSDYEGDDDWRKWCEAMRDGSVAMAKGYRAGDYDAAMMGYQKMTQSCRDCHSAYGIEDE